MKGISRIRRFSRSSSARAAGEFLVLVAPHLPAPRSCSTAAISSGFGRLSAMRRDKLLRMVRDTDSAAGGPRRLVAGAPRLQLVNRPEPRAWRGPAVPDLRERGREIPRRESAKRKSSSPSPSALGPPAAAARWRRGMRSPSINFLLPGRTYSRLPPWRRAASRLVHAVGRNDDLAALSGVLQSPLAARPRAQRACTSALARRMNRWRFARDSCRPGPVGGRSIFMSHLMIAPQLACFTRIYHSTSRRTCRSV